jgi:hypothetical protein
LARVTKVDPGGLQPVEACEVHEGAIEHVDRAGFRKQLVEDPHVGVAGFGDPGEGRDAAPQIQQGVHLHPGLRPAEPGPGKDREAQVDRGRIQSVDGVLPLVQLIEPQRLVDVEATGHLNESLREVGVDTPIALLVGIGRGASRNAAASEAQVVELVR